MSRDIGKKSAGEATIGTEAALVVDFVNTRDVEEGTDAIADPGALAAWMGANLGGPGQAADAGGHRRAIALREALRELLRANNGEEPRAGLLEPLRAAVARSAYRARLAPGGQLTLEPAGAGSDALEARLLLAVERLQAAGEWPRLKACPDEACEWAFYDASRNRSRTWCSMEECGNRAKTRRYRSRRKDPR